MHSPYQIPIWKLAPTIRLLPALLLGIVLQWYLQFSLLFIVASLGCFLAAYFLFAAPPLSTLFQLKKLQAIVLMLLLLIFACLLTWIKDSRHRSSWYGWKLGDSSKLLVMINEPLLIKAKSIKAEAEVRAVVNGAGYTPASGKLLLYFSKDSVLPDLHYGELILINKPLQAIRNSGNPGGFNYKRYAAFHQLFHQVFLKKEDWISTQRF